LKQVGQSREPPSTIVDDSSVRNLSRAIDERKKATKTKRNILCGAFALLALACLALTQNARALNPPPDGGYPGGNTAEGQTALFSLTSGTYNTAVGFFSLRSNTSGNFNTAIGVGTLLLNTGDENTATGATALLSNTTGSFNTASGTQALLKNTTGNFNTANGFEALYGNITGDNNTANGYGALVVNVTGSDNTANGVAALRNNFAGGSNVANGSFALYNNTYGDLNTAIGGSALYNNTNGRENIALGYAAGRDIVTADNVIAIGAPGLDVRRTCCIGNIYATTTVNATTLPVVVSPDGQLGTFSSSQRFKKEIKPMDQISEAILRLKPVTFHYKTDNKGTPQFGLIAEEVADVNPDLVVRDEKGEIYTVRYDAVNAMLLNEFLKTYRKVDQQGRIVQDQQAIIADLKSTVVQQEKGIKLLTARLEEQDSKIQKVSAQLATVSPPVVDSKRRIVCRKLCSTINR